MSNPSRDPIAMTGFVAALGLAFVGLAICGLTLRDLAFAVPALVLLFGSGAWHDRQHRRRGEPGHVIWGTRDRMRPFRGRANR